MISIHSSHTGRDVRRRDHRRYAGDFNPLFPYGKRRRFLPDTQQCTKISIHSSHTGRDERFRRTSTGRRNFNPLFPYGKRLWEPTEASFHVTISIHSSHTGRDFLDRRKAFLQLRFQSTLPIREETGWIGELPAMSAYFNPLFPYGKRRDRDLRTCEKRGHFNPLFPYGKRLCPGGLGLVRRIISIHSSHTGRDGVRITAIQILVLFQSTLPIREETWRRWCR